MVATCSRFSIIFICTLYCHTYTSACEHSAVSDTADCSGYVQRHGKLKLSGTQLVDAYNQPVQLRGLSSHGLQWHRECVTFESLSHLVDTWGINVFRAAVYLEPSENGYLVQPEYFISKLSDIIQWCETLGIYVIIDWHVHNPTGDPNDFLDSPGATTGIAMDFWRYIANTYKDKSHVIYEIANEPSNTPWSTILVYHNVMIAEIRKIDPDTIIIAGTPFWSQQIEYPASTPVNQPYNVMYAFHFYAASHDFLFDYVKSYMDVVPLFVTEWGVSDYTTTGGYNTEMAQKFLDLFAGEYSETVVSWTAWQFSDKDEYASMLSVGACSARAWDNTICPGTFIRNHLITENLAGGSEYTCLSTEPVSLPSAKPTLMPTTRPTWMPSTRPTLFPTRSMSPTSTPTLVPSLVPTTRAPTVAPTTSPPTPMPTAPAPTPSPTPAPTPAPTMPEPTVAPTSSPTPLPTIPTTPVPTRRPTTRPSLRPTTPSTPSPTIYPGGMVCTPWNREYCSNRGYCSFDGAGCVCDDYLHYWPSEQCSTWHRGRELKAGWYCYPNTVDDYCSWQGLCSADGLSCNCFDSEHRISADRCAQYYPIPPDPDPTDLTCSPGIDRGFCFNRGVCNATGNGCVCDDTFHWASERCEFHHFGPELKTDQCCVPGERDYYCGWVGVCDDSGMECVCDNPGHRLPSERCQTYHPIPVLTSVPSSVPSTDVSSSSSCPALLSLPTDDDDGNSGAHSDDNGSSNSTGISTIWPVLVIVTCLVALTAAGAYVVFRGHRSPNEAPESIISPGPEFDLDYRIYATQSETTNLPGSRGSRHSSFRHFGSNYEQLTDPSNEENVILSNRFNEVAL